MNAYVPISRDERKKMLASAGVELESLFSHIPEELRFDLNELEGLGNKGLSEYELAQYFSRKASQNRTVEELDSYLGAGFYDHYIPSAIHHLIQRQEFLTSYTPYQQEISQGTLQATFEWQTDIARLSGMPVSNSSMYDGASACAEAALMALRSKPKASKVWISSGVHPQAIETCQTYLQLKGFEVEVGELNESGTCLNTTPEAEGYAAFIIQSPNYYGVVENIEKLSEAAHRQGALSVVYCDPIALALFKSPGDCGADIVFGEAQPLGAALNYGGPGLGYLCCTEALVRKMPGRICGATKDADGKRAYVLTLQAREQHIRREKATSNICTAEALLATAAAIYVGLLGRDGLKQIAFQCADKARYLAQSLVETGRFELVYPSPFFREFAVRLKGEGSIPTLNQALLDKQVLGGLALDQKTWLLAVTEKKSRQQMDHFVQLVLDILEKEGQS